LIKTIEALKAENYELKSRLSIESEEKENESKRYNKTIDMKKFIYAPSRECLYKFAELMKYHKYTGSAYT
jgi:hypothetical protein